MSDATVPTSLAVLIASTGRPAVLGETLRSVLAQRPAPGVVVVSTIREEDLLPEWRHDARVRHVVGAGGLPRQLNRALDALGTRPSFIFIFDDDVELAGDYITLALEQFDRNPGLVLFDGWPVRDGGVTRTEAQQALLEPPDARELERPVFEPRPIIYGCNMCVRGTVFEHVRFEEELPAYAWLFEWDFVRRCGRLGETGRYRACRFVHVKDDQQRLSGVRFGYSQVMNPIFLWRRGTLRARELVWPFVWKNIGVNLVRAIKGDKKVDRVGRLIGNLLAFKELVLGRIRPSWPESVLRHERHRAQTLASRGKRIRA